jgi:hypothetical protein
MHKVGISDHHWHGDDDNHHVAEKRELERAKGKQLE